MPTQIPAIGRCAVARSRRASSSPWRASPAAALSTWPTPAISASGASRTSSASVVTTGSTPARASAGERAEIPGAVVRDRDPHRALARDDGEIGV